MPFAGGFFKTAFLDGNHSYEAVYQSLDQTSRPHTDYYALIFLSTVICTFGLLLDNTAVIIGAMLIAPLMNPILGIAFSSLTNNGAFLFRSVFTVASGVLLCVLISWLLTLMFTSLGTVFKNGAR